MCGDCAARKTSCSYAAISAPACVSPDADAHNLALQVIEARIADVVGDVSKVKGIAARSKLLRDLQHFSQSTALELGMKENQHVITTSQHLVWTYPQLMHLTLALSNAHARKLYGGTELTTQFALAQTVHWQIALQQYRSALRLTRAKELGDGDGLAASTYFLTMAGLCIDDEMPVDVFETCPGSISNALEPFALVGSLQSLLGIFPQLASTSGWGNILRATAGSFQPLQFEALPPAFTSLCNLEDGPALDQDMYYIILCHITPLLREPPCKKHLARLFGMIGHVWPELRNRISRREPKALLLFSWWLALLARLDLWWATTRAVSCIRAILTRLAALDYAQLKPFLAFPASRASTDCQWIWYATETTDDST